MLGVDSVGSPSSTIFLSNSSTPFSISICFFFVFFFSNFWFLHWFFISLEPGACYFLIMLAHCLLRFDSPMSALLLRRLPKSAYGACCGHRWATASVTSAKEKAPRVPQQMQQRCEAPVSAELSGSPLAYRFDPSKPRRFGEIVVGGALLSLMGWWTLLYNNCMMDTSHWSTILCWYLGSAWKKTCSAWLWGKRSREE